MRIGRSFNISNLPWDQPIIEANLAQFRNPKVLPQLMALFNTIKLIRNEDGKFSATLTLDELRKRILAGEFFFMDGAPVTSNMFAGMLSLVKYTPRSGILGAGAQSLPANRRFAGDVPLFLSAFKEFRDVKYSDWDLKDEGLARCTDKYLVEVFKHIGSEVDYSPEDLLQLGVELRTNKGGKSPGSIVSKNSYATKSTSDPEFNALPVLVRLMLTQLWLYQPINNSKYSIRNLLNPDALSEPLIDVEVFTPTTKQEDNIPW